MGFFLLMLPLGVCFLGGFFDSSFRRKMYGPQGGRCNSKGLVPIVGKDLFVVWGLG